MSRMRRHRTLLSHPLILLALQSTASAVALAQGDSAEIPENAHANSYGSGWQCDYGYRAVDEVGWRYFGGFCVRLAGSAIADIGVDEACVAVKVPENSYLANFAFGPGWQCDRGYRAVDEACVAIRVPENGYSTNSAYGSGWQCDRGYRAVDELAWPSRCRRTAIWRTLRTDLAGSAIADIERSMRLAWPSECPRTLTSTFSGTAGSAIRHTGSNRTGAHPQ